MLNGKYELVKQAGALKVRYCEGPKANASLAIFNDDEDGLAMFEGAKQRILFDGGTLFDVESDRYLVGDMSQLMKTGR